MEKSPARHLEHGIYLEDEAVMLDWNSSRDVLIQIAGPQVDEAPGKRLQICWRNRHWLGGLPVTFAASLKSTERLRRIELMAVAGKRPVEVFQVFSRQLVLHLGSATHKTEKPAISSMFWRRGKIEITLGHNRQVDTMHCTISYHGPEIITEKMTNQGMDRFNHHLTGLGLSVYGWHQLKEYLLDLEAGKMVGPPPGFDDHLVVALALRYCETRDKSYLDKAAAKLTGYGRDAWLILYKS